MGMATRTTATWPAAAEGPKGKAQGARSKVTENLK